MSSTLTEPGSPRAPGEGVEVTPRGRRRWFSGNLLLGCGLAAALAVLAFLTTGGVDLAPNTWVELGLITLAAALGAAVVVIGAPGRRWGGGTLLLFGVLAGLTYASIAWSVQPASSWVEANRTISYLAAFGAAGALARLAPGRWPALVGALAAFATVVCVYALIVKVFPATLDSTDPLGRLRAPFDYYNATALAAGMGLPAVLWAGTRPEYGRLARALSVPAISVLVSALVLSFSRGTILAALVGLACWLVLVPLRLRATLLLALGCLGAAAVTAWALTHHPLSHDGASLTARTLAGHQFGVVLVVVLALMSAAGFATSVAMDRIALPAAARRRIGAALLTVLALVPVVAIAAAAASSRGLTGEVSHAWRAATNENSVITNTPARIGNLANSRPRYWSDGFKVGEHALLAGTGALGYATARTRYSNDPLPAQHAHSYVVETFADLGLVGLAVSLALLAAWLLAVGRTRAGPAAHEHAGERAGLNTLLAVAVIFGVHSLIDWTWFIPGVAVPAMLCAGWLAFRGPLGHPVGILERRRRLLDAPARAGALAGIVAVTAFALWIVWQPLRSANADAAATDAAQRGDVRAAIEDARTAAASNPVSVDPLLELSALYSGLADTQAAHRELTAATNLQPGNPVTWEQLAAFDVQHQRRAEAVHALEIALRLHRSSTQDRQLLADAQAAHG